MAAISVTDRRETFERIVREAEALSASSPSAYTRKVVLLALLGYAVLFGIVLLLAGLVGALVWAVVAGGRWAVLVVAKKFGLGFVALIWAIARALWVRLDPPTGYVLDRARFPALHAVIDDVRARLRSVPIHDVLLTDAFNASVTQTPRLGVFGWHRNTLMLGLPLLMALTPEQARSVVAHEFGHLSANHSRLGGWIYRVRTSWYRVMEAFDERSSFVTAPVRRFFDWYAPYFAAYSFVLARANEYEADRTAATVTTPRVTAEALMAAAIRDDVVTDEYWRPLYGRADREPAAARAPYHGLAAFLSTYAVPAEDLARRVSDASRRATDDADTHPSLSDRLRALGVRAEDVVPAPGRDTAAAAWLGETYATVLHDFESRWHEANDEAWAEAFTAAGAARAELATLRAATRPLTPDEQWRLAAFTERFLPDDDPLPLYRAYQERRPDDPDGDFAIGRLLCARGDATGLAHLEKAAESLGHVPQACGVAFAFHTRRHEADAAHRWRLRAERHEDLMERARAERATLRTTDQVSPCDLGDDVIAPLVDQLRGFPFVKAAWIGRKVVEHVPEAPVYVVVYQSRGLVLDESARTEQIASVLEFPHTVFVLMKNGSGRALARRVVALGRQIL